VNDTIIEELEEQARSNPQRIAFPESLNNMILKAAAEVAARGIGYPWLIGSRTVIEEAAAAAGVPTKGFAVFDNTDEDTVSQLALDYTARFDDLSEKSVRRKAKDPVNCAMLLLKLGIVDGVAAGRECTTADVIIAAQGIVGLKEGFSAVSSVGIVNAPGFEGPEGSMLVIADCAINPNPDSNDLADIAIASADTAAMLLGWEPRVAMLSFSTCGSAEHESIDVIRKAIDIVRVRRPALKIDGEFQLDSAILPRTAEKKVRRDSAVAGKANVLIFPNLHAGNIGVKLIQTFGKADAYGPVLQGFAKPVCDFSRSAPLSEMMGNIIMLIVRAQKEK
jgi:phosphate acetyltransferase